MDHEGREGHEGEPVLKRRGAAQSLRTTKNTKNTNIRLQRRPPSPFVLFVFFVVKETACRPSTSPQAPSPSYLWWLSGPAPLRAKAVRSRHAPSSRAGGVPAGTALPSHAWLAPLVRLASPRRRR